VGDEDYDSVEAAKIRHFNSQATSIRLASLCREEYNKVQGLKNAKEIWYVLKTAHEGDEVTKITKREMIGENSVDSSSIKKRMKIKTTNHLKRRTLINGEMKMIKTRKIINRFET
jgi:hypothetical protein